jgi:hypothetical protein
MKASHLIQKVLQSETWNLSGGNHRRFKCRSTSKKRPVTRDIKIIIIIIIIINFLLLMFWQKSHRAIYSDSKGRMKSTPNNKLQKK